MNPVYWQFHDESGKLSPTGLGINAHNLGLLVNRRWFCAFCIVLGFVLAGCGTVATEVWEAPTATVKAVVTEGESNATATTVEMPTLTTIPPTNTPIPEPTETFTPEPTIIPEPTSTKVMSPIDRMVAARDPDKGAMLFEIFQERAGTGYSCANCHSPTSEEKLVGPGLLNISERASTRVEGQTAAEYIFNSIVNPMDHVVEDYDPELMPANWTDIYTNLEIFAIVAYLLTLEG